MKILRYEPNEKSQKLFTLGLSFDNKSGILSGTVGTASANGDLILDINIDLNEWVGKVIDVMLSATNNGYEVITFNALQNYSMGNGLPSAPESRPRMMTRLFRMFVHKNIDDSIIQIRQGHEEIEGFENIIEDGNPELSMFNLSRHDPEAALVIEIARAKSDMLGKVDQRDSVAYLEAQVDLLTRLYLESHANKSGELIDLLRLADSSSVLNVKSKDSLIKEFTEKKTLVRQAQQEYYDAKTVKTIVA